MCIKPINPSSASQVQEYVCHLSAFISYMNHWNYKLLDFKVLHKKILNADISNHFSSRPEVDRGHIVTFTVNSQRGMVYDSPKVTFSRL